MACADESYVDDGGIFVSESDANATAPTHAGLALRDSTIVCPVTSRDTLTSLVWDQGMYLYIRVAVVGVGRG